MEMEWIDTKKELPVIPDGKHSVSVMVSVHDPIYEEINPGHGSDTQTALFDGEWFKQIGHGPKGWSFLYIGDIVTHWMYLPYAVKVNNNYLEGYDNG